MITRRHNTRLSLMVCGAKGSGKSAFFNSLVNKDIVKQSGSKEIDIYILNLDCDGSIQKITLIDTPGFGDSMNDEALQDSIVDYIKDQFDSFIEEETKIRRNAKFEDTRVHCLVYLIPGTGHGLKERDIVFLRKVTGLVNIVPVISKAEGMTDSELVEVKSLVNDQLQHYRIKTFDFENESLLPNPVIEQGLNSILPFACVFPENIGEDLRIRDHPHRTVEIDNPSHNDYCRLRNVILNTHTEAFIEVTDTELYERYRSDALENILQE